MNTLKPKTHEHLKQYEPMIRSWAKKYTMKGLGEFDDMLQDAYMVYLNACNKFDPDKGVTFSTYLYVSLRNKMYQKFREVKRNRTVSLDNFVNEDTTFLELIENKHYQIDSDLLTLIYQGYSVREISRQTGINRRKLKKMIDEERKQNKTIYFL